MTVKIKKSAGTREIAFSSLTAESNYTFKANKVAIFSGPSIAKEKILRLLPQAHVRPPIKRGDLREVVNRGFNVIGIIDGTYISEPTLSADEIFWALRKGVHLYGAASLGALRAVEFEAYGMQGVGTIFNWYRRGLTFRDDEVVVRMEEDTFRSLCDPLVNLRYALICALNRRVVSRRIAQSILSVYQHYFYAERTYARLFKHLLAGHSSTRSDSKAIAQFRDFVLENKESLDLKARDSQRLIELIKDNYWIG